MTVSSLLAITTPFQVAVAMWCSLSSRCDRRWIGWTISSAADLPPTRFRVCPLPAVGEWRPGASAEQALGSGHRDRRGAHEDLEDEVLLPVLDQDGQVRIRPEGP